MRTIAVSVCALAAMLAVTATAAAEPHGQARLSVTIADPQTGPVAGGEYPVSGQVTNAGQRPRRATVRAYLRSPAGDVFIGSDRTRRVRDARRFDIVGLVPASLAGGAYDLVACVRKRGNGGPRRCTGVGVTVTTSTEPVTPVTPPDFQPGARTLGDPLLPQIGNGGYDARHYDIALDYDPIANSFDAAATTMSATATQDLSELSLDFQDLPVDRVLVNGVAASFTQVDATPALAGGGTQPMKLVIDPAAGIPNASTFAVRVEYHGTPQVFTDPDGSDEGWIPNPSCPAQPACSYFVVGEPMGSQAWFPSNNHPSDKASVDTTITVPNGQTAVGVGELAGRVANVDGTTTWQWREDSPTSTYLLTASTAATPAPNQFQQSSITEALTGRSLPIYDTIATSAALSMPSITSLTARNKEMIDSLGAHYGAWPLGSYGSVWDLNPNVGYALEVQTKSHFSSVVGASTYLHELAHQWWGDAITLHDWNDLWFNEGWAVFSEWLFGFESGSDANSPKDHFDDEYANAPPTAWSTAPAVLDNDPAKMFSPSFPTYTRGAMTLTGFREIIGAAAFDQFARDLQARLAYGNIDTPEFIALAKESSGFTGAELALLDQYFQQWLYGTTKPTLTYDDF